MKLDKIQYILVGAHYKDNLCLEEITSWDFQEKRLLRLYAEGFDEEDIWEVKDRMIVKTKNSCFVHIVLAPYSEDNESKDRENIHIYYNSALDAKVHLSKVILTGNWHR